MRPSNILMRLLQAPYRRAQLVCMKVRAGSQYFRTTTRKESGPDAFEESWLVMTFLDKWWVTEILCSFRLVLEGEAGKEIPESSKLEFSEKFLANSFALSDADDNTSGSLNTGSMADLADLCWEQY